MTSRQVVHSLSTAYGISPKLPEANPTQPITEAHFATSSQQVARRRRHFQERFERRVERKPGSPPQISTQPSTPFPLLLLSAFPARLTDCSPPAQWRASSPLSSGRLSARPPASPPAAPRHRAVLSPPQPVDGATPSRWYANPPFPMQTNEEKKERKRHPGFTGSFPIEDALQLRKSTRR